MGTFRGSNKTKEQIKAQNEARAARKAGNPLPEPKLTEMDLEPKDTDGFVEKIKKKRKRRKAAKKSEVEPDADTKNE